MISAHIRRMFNSVMAVSVAVGGAGAQLDEPFPPFIDLDDEWDSDESPYVRFLPRRDQYYSTGPSAFAAGIGDINNDGYADILVSTSYLGAPGRVVVVYGSEGPHPTHSEDIVADGIQAFEIGVDSERLLCSWVAGVGDVNGDGIADFSVTRMRSGSPVSDGKVYIVYGRDSTAGVTFPAMLSVENLDATEGISIDFTYEDYRATAAGDLNNDGIDDVAFAPYEPITLGVVDGFVLYGRNTAADGSFPAMLTEEYFDGTNGFRIATTDGGTNSAVAAGDVNNDGIDDLVIGSMNLGIRDATSPNGGGFVLFGRDADIDGAFPASIDNSYFDGERGFTMIGEILYGTRSYIGYSVGGAGDLNNDGIDDIAIGTLRERTYVIYGRDSKSLDVFEPLIDLAALDGNVGFKINTDSAALSGVGDVNSDGIADLAIGSPSHTVSQWSSGSVYIIYGRDSTRGFLFPAILDPHHDPDPYGSDYVEIGGIHRGYGGSVSAAGDMNGDGVDDFVTTNEVCCVTALVYGREAATPCPSDANGDGFLTPADFSAWVSAFHSQAPACDQNGDGECSPADFSAWVGNYNAGC